MVSSGGCVIASILLLFVGAEGNAKGHFWSLLDDMATEGVESSDFTTVGEELSQGAGVQVESCSGKHDVMSITRAEFDPNRLHVRVFGTLARNLSGGTLSVKMYEGSAAVDSSAEDWIKREMAWHSVPHKYEEDLCKHFSKRRGERGCPLLTGSIELRFALDKLPPMVVAGSYKLKVKAIDEASNPVACVRVQVDVPRGKSGEIFRRVEALPTVRSGRALQSLPHKILCLHGGGGNGEDFQSSWGMQHLAAEFGSNFVFVFVDAPYAAGLWVPDPPSKDDPTTDPGVANETFALLDEVVETEGPFAGILGFSQGAMAVPLYLSWAPPGTFAFAMMFCGYIPWTHLGLVQMIDDAAPFDDIPALVWIGGNDGIITNEMSYEQASKFTSPTILLSEDAGHWVPWDGDPTMDDIAQFMRSVGWDGNGDGEDDDSGDDAEADGSARTILPVGLALCLFLCHAALPQ